MLQFATTRIHISTIKPVYNIRKTHTSYYEASGLGMSFLPNHVRLSRELPRWFYSLSTTNLKEFIYADIIYIHVMTMLITGF